VIRIDDRRAIDDSLIRVIEYQLFVEETAARGRHHRPDHWDDHRCPPGDVTGPVLGIRFADAVAFCDWVTEREEGGWCCRLPTFEECRKFPLAGDGRERLGYWYRGLGVREDDPLEGFAPPSKTDGFWWIAGEPPSLAQMRTDDARHEQARFERAIEAALERAAVPAEQRWEATAWLAGIASNAATPIPDLTRLLDECVRHLQISRDHFERQNDDPDVLRSMHRRQQWGGMSVSAQLTANRSCADALRRALDDTHALRASLSRDAKCDRALAEAAALALLRNSRAAASLPLDPTIAERRNHNSGQDGVLIPAFEDDHWRSQHFAASLPSLDATTLCGWVLLLDLRSRGELPPFEGIRILRERTL
jgi:hypothetical protein